MGCSKNDTAKGAMIEKGLEIRGSEIKGAKSVVENWLEENGVI